MSSAPSATLHRRESFSSCRAFACECRSAHALKLALPCVAILLSGCATTRAKSLLKAPPPRYTDATHQEIGRVLRYDPAAATALVEIMPLANVPNELAGRELLARHPDTLVPTARLIASPHRQNRVFGAYVVQGTPALGDEVVLPPPAPAPAEPAQPLAPATLKK
ncbi:MAG: hypothetical protein NTU80_03885 [Verrucomicrobia bacterium]|nr:hypothetical protein [Verrucomicrobiota bacterium]